MYKYRYYIYYHNETTPLLLVMQTSALNQFNQSTSGGHLRTVDGKRENAVMHVCVRACVRGCVRACVRVYVCVCVRVCVMTCAYL